MVFVPHRLETPIQKNLCTPMLIAAQFTIAKYWKKPKWPPGNEWIQKLWYIDTMKFYAAERKKELIAFATAWMELESIMLSEISQTVRDKHHMNSFTLFNRPPHTSFPLVITILLSVSMSFCCCCCLIPSPFSLSSATPLHSDSCQSVLCLYKSVSSLFASLFCSLNSTYKWNHMVLVVLWHACFT